MPGDRLMGDIFNSSTKYKGEDLMLSLFNDAYICLASNIIALLMVYLVIH
jgi:hypothetical protein